MKRIGVLAGAFNPLTRAHVALAEAGRGMVDQVICVLPKTYPHKQFHGATLENRLEMLRRAGLDYRITDGGLFIDIARELRAADPEAEIHFICGRDAAERILTWDYGSPGAIDQMLEEFHLLVAARQGTFANAETPRVRHLEMPGNFDEVSSTEVRRRIEMGEAWHHLVPDAIVDLVAEIYPDRTAMFDRGHG